MRPFNQKLSTNLSTNIILPILLVIIILGLSVFVFMSATLETELESKLTSDSLLVLYRLDSLFESSLNLVRQMSVDLQISNYLKTTHSREDITTNPLYSTVLNTLKSIQSSNPKVFLAWVANQRANFYLDSTGTIPDLNYDVTQRPWYSIALSAKGPQFTPPYIEWGTEDIVVSTIEALYENDTVYGFTVIDLRLDSLPEIVSTANVGELGHIFLIDSEGTLMYHEDATKRLKFSLKDEDPHLYNFINTYSSTNNRPRLEHIVFRERSTYLYVANLKHLDWKLILLIDKAEHMSNLYGFLTFLALLTLFLTIAIIIIVLRIMQSKVEPISALTEYGQKVANGHLDETPPYVYANRDDEMGDLARSFVTITEVFKQKNLLLEDIVSSQYEEIQKQYHYILEKEKMASLGTLVAGVAHEINTPLGISVTTASYIDELLLEIHTAMTNGTLTQKDFSALLSALDEGSDLLNKNLYKASELVRQFKAIAINQNIDELCTVRLYDEINNVISTLRPTFKHRNIDIQNQCSKDLILTSFPGALNQIFTNFIINSSNHGYDEDQSGTITIQAIRDGELVRISYADDGKGISNENLEHIFEPFFTTRRNKGNSGLGMYITHNLVTQSLNGTIHCKSELNKGVLFTIVIPLHLEP
jgi:signal transduction histidine kinase